MKKQMLKETYIVQKEMELKKKIEYMEYIQIYQKDTLYDFSELEEIELISKKYANSPSSFDKINIFYTN
jgi:hypothetical protein